MRKAIFASLIVLASGCALMDPEYRSLDTNDPVVAAILASGESQAAKLEALSAVVGHPVLDYGEVGDAVVAKIQAPLDEALDAAADEIMENVGKASSPVDFLAILAGGLLTGGGVLVSRTKERKK